MGVLKPFTLVGVADVSHDTPREVDDLTLTHLAHNLDTLSMVLFVQARSSVAYRWSRSWPGTT